MIYEFITLIPIAINDIPYVDYDFHLTTTVVKESDLPKLLAYALKNRYTLVITHDPNYVWLMSDSARIDW